MARLKVNNIEVEIGSGNVFADLGLPDAEQLKIKSGLVIQIARAIRRLGLTQVQAGKRMDISQSKVSGLMRGYFSNLSEQKLMECLSRALDTTLKSRCDPLPNPSAAVPSLSLDAHE